MDQILISGFADEIAPEFDRQLAALQGLGMKWLSLRGADGKNIAEYTPEEAEERLLPRLRAAGIGVSSLGSPIGKIDLGDDAGFLRQLGQMENLCRICELLSCAYIRGFSFYIPEGEEPDRHLDSVAEKVSVLRDVAGRHGVTLILENEKGVFGDTGPRCRMLLDRVGGPACRAVFDFANFVQCGEDPAVCWELLKRDVAYIHIKDARYAGAENVLCGAGEGKIPQILRQAVVEEGYRGFLTLEPHLAVFQGLSALERERGETVIGDNGVRDGAAGFAMQYRALKEILDELQIKEVS